MQLVACDRCWLIHDDRMLMLQLVIIFMWLKMTPVYYLSRYQITKVLPRRVLTQHLKDQSSQAKTPKRNFLSYSSQAKVQSWPHHAVCPSDPDGEKSDTSNINGRIFKTEKLWNYLIIIWKVLGNPDTNATEPSHSYDRKSFMNMVRHILSYQRAYSIQWCATCARSGLGINARSKERTHLSTSEKSLCPCVRTVSRFFASTASCLPFSFCLHGWQQLPRSYVPGGGSSKTSPHHHQTASTQRNRQARPASANAHTHTHPHTWTHARKWTNKHDIIIASSSHALQG